MIKITNPNEFIEALKLSHESGEKAFGQFINFLERFSQEDYDLHINHDIGGNEFLLGWTHSRIKYGEPTYNLYGGMLFDKEKKTWSLHT